MLSLDYGEESLGTRIPEDVLFSRTLILGLPKLLLFGKLCIRYCSYVLDNAPLSIFKL